MQRRFLILSFITFFIFLSVLLDYLTDSAPFIKTIPERLFIYPTNKPAKDNFVLLLKGEKMDINKADISNLILLPTIGEKLSKRILYYLKEKKRVKNIEQLLEIKGIGKKRIKVIKRYFTVYK